MRRQTYTQGMALLAATWPDRAPSQDTLSAYWLVLHDLDDSVFSAAITSCLKTCTFYPKPAEILAKCMAALDRAGLLPPSPDLAWNEALTLTLRHWHPDTGWLGEQRFTNELIEQGVRAIGGQRRIAMADMREIGYIRKEFIDFYDHKRKAEIEYSPELLRQALPEAVKVPELAEAEG